MDNRNHIGFCNICKTDDVEIVFQWTSFDRKHCYNCNLERQRLNKMAKVRELLVLPKIVRQKPFKQRTPISKVPTKKLSDKRNRDKEVNDHIWATRAHECFECKRGLVPHRKPPKEWFSHILGKGAHPELRFDPENIVLHCKGCHHDWEFGGKREKMRTYAYYYTYMQDNGYIHKD